MKGLVFVLWMAASGAAAQSAQGVLAGRAVNADGAPIVGAGVSAIHDRTGAAAQAITGPDGRYELTGLAPGLYRVRVHPACCSYRDYEDEIVIEAGGRREFPIEIAYSGLPLVEGDDPGTISAGLRARQVVPDGPAPRTREGRPDLSGVWLISNDPFPEPARALDWAEELAQQRIADQFRDHPHTRCLPGSPPLDGSASPFIGKFVQTPDLLVMLTEGVPGFRQVFLDGRPHPPSFDPTWIGHSVGRWEGDTLVVDTVGYNSEGWTNAYPRTEMLRTTERYRRVDYGTLEARITFDDPGVFVEPWTWDMTWHLAPQEELLEYVCENNKWAPAQ
jgi:Carboxypeptidase regulatory-like domain